MARIDRRRLLRLSGAGALAGSGGLVAILASGRAPAAHAELVKIYG
jgi:hypothetical protein